MTEILDYLDDIFDGVDVGGVVVLEDGHLDELHVVREIVPIAEVAVVDGGHIVVAREAVREVRADEACAARDEDACRSCMILGQNSHYVIDCRYWLADIVREVRIGLFGGVR